MLNAIVVYFHSENNVNHDEHGLFSPYHCKFRIQSHWEQLNTMGL